MSERLRAHALSDTQHSHSVHLSDWALYGAGAASTMASDSYRREVGIVVRFQLRIGPELAMRLPLRVVIHGQREATGVHPPSAQLLHGCRRTQRTSCACLGAVTLRVLAPGAIIAS